MSLINPNDGNPSQPAGGTEQPTSSPSGSAGQPLPEYVKELQSQLAELTTMVKGVQKGTDKQIGQVRGDIKRILELKEQGLNESQIQRELFVDQLMSGQSAPAPEQPTGSGKQGPVFDVEAIVEKLQFAENDPSLAALRIIHQDKPGEFAKAAAALRLSQLTGISPTPGTGFSVTSGQGTPSEQARIETETQNYIKEMQGASGKGARFGDAIKDAYRAKGVPVDSIHFKYS